jgi:hypothetical protein
VFLVEPEAAVVAIAEEIARANGFAGVVQCWRERIEEVELPEPVSVLVSVLTGNFLLSEDLLPSLIHARDRWLAPGGVLIPGAATMEAVPVGAAGLHTQEIAAWSTLPVEGVDTSVARAYAANTPIARGEGLREAIWLAEPATLRRMNFSTETDPSVRATVDYTVLHSGACHGCLGWFSIDLDGQWLSTSPHEAETHWSPVLLPIDPPLVLEKGERVTFTLDRPAFGEWAWRMAAASGHRAHSTFLASPLKTEDLRRAKPAFVPKLGGPGQRLRRLFELCDGVRSIGQIADQLWSEYPDRFQSQADALATVQRVMARYAH